MNHYERVEIFYKINEKYLSQIEHYFNNKLNIPKNIVKDTIKGYIVEINQGCRLEKLIGYKKRDVIKIFFVYYIFFIYILIKGVFYKQKSSFKNYDIIFDYHGSLSEKRYEKILDNNLKKAFINISTQKNSIDLEKKYKIYNANSQFRYSFKLKYIFNLYKNFFFSFLTFHKISKKTNINFIRVVLSIYKQILSINTDLDNIKAKIFMSFIDNGFDSLRYYYYKKSFDVIMLIQNGTRAGYSSCHRGNMYTYSDYYFSFGLKSTDSQKGMVCKNIISIGSLNLYDNMQIYNKNEIVYDILFIEQLGPGDGFILESYMQCIKMLCTFSLKYNYKIVYRVAMTRNDLLTQGKECTLVNERRKTAEIIDGMLKKAGIIIDEYESENSYEAVSKSNVISFYASTLGFEALAYNKKVLNMNLDRTGNGFSLKDEIGVLLKDDFKLFEEKLLMLLEDSDNSFVDSYYKDTKKSFMNLDGDPIEKINYYLDKEINLSAGNADSLNKNSKNGKI